MAADHEEQRAFLNYILQAKVEHTSFCNKIICSDDTHDDYDY